MGAHEPRDQSPDEPGPASGCGCGCLSRAEPLATALGTVTQVTLAQGPALSAALSYLGASLSSQIGWFDAVSQHQHRATLGTAVSAAGVARLHGRRGGPPPVQPPPNLGTGPPQAPAGRVAAAMSAAEEAVKAAELNEASSETGF